MMVRSTRKKRGVFLLFLLLILPLSSCSTEETPKTNPGIVFLKKKKKHPERDVASSLQLLSRAADRVARDWDEFLGFQRHLPPTALGNSQADVSGHLAQRYTMSYVGPVDNFLRAIGKTIRWKSVVIGVPPAAVPTIEIDAKKERLFTILRDAGVQISPQAWIILQREKREIDLVYPPPDSPQKIAARGQK